jgi:putative aldouronate transport system permease protein
LNGTKKDQAHTKKHKNGFFSELKRNKTLYLMFMPVAIWYIAFRYYPMAGIVVAFKNYNYRDGIFNSPWNGFDNFEYFFKSGKALQVTLNTVMYNVIFLLIYIVCSALLAILLAELTNKIFKKVAQTIIFLPYFISWVVISSLVYRLFDYNTGVLNHLATMFGGEPIDLATNTGIWYFILPILYMFKWVGYGSVLFLAAIVGLDASCYEAAKIDGANSFQKIKFITIPLLKPTTITLVLLGVGRIMRGEFDMFYQMVGKNSLLMDTTDIIDTFVFRSLMMNSNFGMASASAFYQSVLCFVIIILVNKAVKMVDADSALF